MLIRACVPSVFGLMLLAAATAGGAEARSPFDGSWSVLIITESGDCDRAYRYAVRVANGVMHYDGDASIKLTGRVSTGGRVRATISGGDKAASATGRLSRNAGYGTWTGKSAQQCRGRWEAERR